MISINNENLQLILSQPPIELPPGAMPSTPISMRVGDLKRVIYSPFQNQEKENYGSGPLSQRIIEERKAQRITWKRNGSLVVTVDGQYTIAFSGPAPWNPHAELKALSKFIKGFAKDKIIIVYTERFCCPRCFKKLKEWLHPTTKIVFSIEYTPTKDRQKRNEKKFANLAASQGVTEPKRRRLIDELR